VGEWRRSLTELKRSRVSPLSVCKWRRRGGNIGVGVLSLLCSTLYSLSVSSSPSIESQHGNNNNNSSSSRSRGGSRGLDRHCEWCLSEFKASALLAIVRPQRAGLQRRRLNRQPPRLSSSKRLWPQRVFVRAWVAWVACAGEAPFSYKSKRALVPGLACFPPCCLIRSVRCSSFSPSLLLSLLLSSFRLFLLLSNQPTNPPRPSPHCIRLHRTASTSTSIGLLLVDLLSICSPNPIPPKGKEGRVLSTPVALPPSSSIASFPLCLVGRLVSLCRFALSSRFTRHQSSRSLTLFASISFSFFFFPRLCPLPTSLFIHLHFLHSFHSLHSLPPIQPHSTHPPTLLSLTLSPLSLSLSPSLCLLPLSRTFCTFFSVLWPSLVCTTILDPAASVEASLCNPVLFLHPSHPATRSPHGFL